MQELSVSGFASVLPVYSSDTSGVCSALYELGGMTVVHDASGCNSTYATHDEPRWPDMESMIYISGLTELEAVMGGEDRLTDSIVRACRELHPAFLALCGSPVPMLLNTDYEALAQELEQILGIPCFGIQTNAVHSYIWGASKAFEALVSKFAEPAPRGRGGRPRLAVLGATPLDFPYNGTAPDIRQWAEKAGFSVTSFLSMGADLSDAVRAGSADVCLVVSEAGSAAARVLRGRFGIPAVTGVPFGRVFSGMVADALLASLESGKDIAVCSRRGREQDGAYIAVAGESVVASSLAWALETEGRGPVRVLAPLGDRLGLLGRQDGTGEDEDSARAFFAGACAAAADPLFRPICPDGIPFYSWPHFAFSGRCYAKQAPRLVAGPAVFSGEKSC